MLNAHSAFSLFSICAIALAGCGRDEVNGDSSRDGRGLVTARRAFRTVGPIAHDQPLASTVPHETVSVRRLLPTVVFVDEEPAPPPPAPRPLVLEWTLQRSTMEALIGERLVYQDPDSGKVVLGLFEVDGLLVTEQLDGADGFVPIPFDEQFVLGPKVSSFPMTFWAADRSALVELQNCQIDIPSSRFECFAEASATIALYDMQAVADRSALPEALWCIDGCPMPLAPPDAPFFPRVPSTEAFAHQVYAYEFDVAKDALMFEEHPILPEAGRSIVSGALFEPSDDNIKALACEGEAEGFLGACLWAPLPVFYTYSVDADHILPYRGAAVVGALP